MAGKNTFLDHNISCDMDMLNEFSEGVSGLFMNAQDILSESQGILRSIEGIVGSIPGEARYAGLVDSIHGCLSKIRMCDMGAIGFQIIGKTNNYVENMYSIDREYAEKIKQKSYPGIIRTKEVTKSSSKKNKLYLEADSLLVCSSDPYFVSNNSSEEGIKLQEKLKTLQHYNDAYNHVQDQRARDYYRAKVNEYFHNEIQPTLSNKITNAYEVTGEYAEENKDGKEINEIEIMWKEVLLITKCCSNVLTYKNNYGNITSEIDQIISDINDGKMTAAVAASEQIKRKNDRYYLDLISIYNKAYIDAKNNPIVTREQFKKINWSEMTEREYIQMNIYLKEYGITTEDSVQMFLATCLHESGGGSSVLENGSAFYYDGQSYKKEIRGVGYCQLTHFDNQEKFLEYKEDPLINEINGMSEDEVIAEYNIAEYIARNYSPWDVSCYVWAEASYSGEKNLNTYSKVNGCNERTFLATQYFINGYPTKETEFNKDLGEIVHENIEYSFSSDYMHLYVNGREYKAPKNWEDRKAQFNNVQEAFK